MGPYTIRMNHFKIRLLILVLILNLATILACSTSDLSKSIVNSGESADSQNLKQMAIEHTEKSAQSLNRLHRFCHFPLPDGRQIH